MAPDPAEGDVDSLTGRVSDDRGWRITLAMVGVATLATGAVAVFVTSNGTGSGALVAVGALCVVVAVMWDRVKTVKGAGIEVELLQAAQKKSLLRRKWLTSEATTMRRLGCVVKPKRS